MRPADVASEWPILSGLHETACKRLGVTGWAVRSPEYWQRWMPFVAGTGMRILLSRSTGTGTGSAAPVSETASPSECCCSGAGASSTDNVTTGAANNGSLSNNVPGTRIVAYVCIISRPDGYKVTDFGCDAGTPTSVLRAFVTTCGLAAVSAPASKPPSAATSQAASTRASGTATGSSGIAQAAVSSVSSEVPVAPGSLGASAHLSVHIAASPLSAIGPATAGACTPAFFPHTTAPGGTGTAQAVDTTGGVRSDTVTDPATSSALPAAGSGSTAAPAGSVPEVSGPPSLILPRALARLLDPSTAKAMPVAVDARSGCTCSGGGEICGPSCACGCRAASGTGAGAEGGCGCGTGKPASGDRFLYSDELDDIGWMMRDLPAPTSTTSSGASASEVSSAGTGAADGASGSITEQLRRAGEEDRLVIWQADWF